ncbi:MAG TPA: MFS transporter [Candidatus Limnocylindrales bacterium]|jgi:DHA1 family tetracycline resistance protein-like MFS transporter
MTSLRRKRVALAIMLAITFLSTMGFTLVFPVLPFIVERLVGDTGSVAVWVGVLGSVYAGCALFAAPILGTLSDRIGRKPVLVVSLVGTAVGWILFGIGGSIAVLLVARIIDGVTAGDQAVAFAYLADITEPDERPRIFGLVGAVSGVGLLIGPAIGGLLAGIDLALPIFAAAAATGLTALLALIALPESLEPAKRATGSTPADLNPFGTLMAAVKRPGLGSRILVFALLVFTLTVVSTNFPVLTLDVLSWGPTQLGLLLSVVGVVDIVVQGGLLGLMVKAAGERGVVIGGLLGLVGASALIIIVASVVPSAALFVAAALVFAVSEGATSATLQATLSQSVEAAEQGGLAGGLSSVSSAVGLIAPLLAGALYAGVSPAAPYVLSLGAIVAALVLMVSRLSSHTDQPVREAVAG